MKRSRDNNDIIIDGELKHLLDDLEYKVHNIYDLVDDVRENRNEIKKVFKNISKEHKEEIYCLDKTIECYQKDLHILQIGEECKSCEHVHKLYTCANCNEKLEECTVCADYWNKNEKHYFCGEECYDEFCLK